MTKTCNSVLGLNPSADATAPNELDNPNQWYRFIVPLFLHSGVIHVGLCLIALTVLGAQIERSAGFLRTMLIFAISGIGGWITSGVFSPNAVETGSDPAIFGFLGGEWRVVCVLCVYCIVLCVVLYCVFVRDCISFLSQCCFNVVKQTCLRFGCLLCSLFLNFPNRHSAGRGPAAELEGTEAE